MFLAEKKIDPLGTLVLHQYFICILRNKETVEKEALDNSMPIRDYIKIDL